MTTSEVASLDRTVGRLGAILGFSAALLASGLWLLASYDGDSRERAELRIGGDGRHVVIAADGVRAASANASVELGPRTFGLTTPVSRAELSRSFPEGLRLQADRSRLHIISSVVQSGLIFTRPETSVALASRGVGLTTGDTTLHMAPPALTLSSGNRAQLQSQVLGGSHGNVRGGVGGSAFAVRGQGMWGEVGTGDAGSEWSLTLWGLKSRANGSR